MSDSFRIIPPVVRAEGKDVPPEQIQAAINNICTQTTVALNSVAADPTGPAGGDLSGFYPNPTVSAVHATSGTASGVAVTGSTVDSSVIGGTTPAAGHFTTVDATTPIAATSGGTGRNALNANSVIIGEGSSAVNFASPTATAGVPLVSNGAALDPSFGTASVAGGGTGRTTLTANAVVIGEGTSGVNFAAPGTSGQILASNGAAVDPTFQTKTALAIASSGANSDITSLSGLTTPLSVPQGGTGRATLTAHGVLLGEGTAAINQTAVGTTGQMLLGVTGADPAFGNNPTITGGTIDGAVIGGTTPAAGSFTTLSSTGNFTPSQTNGIVGTTTNNNANAGSVGEILTNKTTGTSLTSVTNANIASVSLTAGDWDVFGMALYAPAAGTTVSVLVQGLSTTSATFGASETMSRWALSFTTGSSQQMPAPVTRITLAATTTVFLVAQATFGVSTMTADGFIRARRVR